MTTGSIFWAVIFAGSGGVLVLVGLLMELEKDWYENLSAFKGHKFRKFWGEWLVIFGIGIEIFVAGFSAIDAWLTGRDVKSVRQSNKFLFMHSQGREKMLEQPSENPSDPGQKFEGDLKRMPKGTARIFVVKGDPEASFFASGLMVHLYEGGWTAFPPKEMSESEFKSFFSTGIGGGGGVALVAPPGTDMETQDFAKLTKFKNLNAVTNVFEILKTNTPFNALNAAFSDCGFQCGVGGFSGETNGIIEIGIGQKVW